MLLAIWPNGQHMYIVNEYESIQRVFENGPFDFTFLGPSLGMYIDDEGLLNGSLLNVPASFFACSPIYGPVVACHGLTDDEGGTLPCHPAMYSAMAKFTGQWRLVIDAGGEQILSPFTGDVPVPQVIGIEDVATYEDFLRATGEDDMPPGA